VGFLMALWLPIVITGVVLFFASSVAWTVLPHHQSDFDKLQNEDEVMAALRKINVADGIYQFPYMTHKDAQNAERMERYKQGPRGMLTLWPMHNMGRNLGLTFVYFLVISTVTAYIAWSSIGPNAGFMKAFQITGAIGVLVFASSGQLNAVWFPRRTLNDFIDGIVYGILMGLIFGLLWPAG
jgi:hypothetical protein